MNRLTYKLDEPVKTKYLNYEYNRIKDHDIMRGNFGRITDDMIFNKLGKLEDIEEELGIDLRTLFKALKNGFYYYDNGIVHTSNNENYISLQAQSCLPNQMCIEVDYGDYSTMCFYFEDYGKTWSLNKSNLVCEIVGAENE